MVRSYRRFSCRSPGAPQAEFHAPHTLRFPSSDRSDSACPARALSAPAKPNVAPPIGTPRLPRSRTLQSPWRHQCRRGIRRCTSSAGPSTYPKSLHTDRFQSSAPTQSLCPQPALPKFADPAPVSPPAPLAESCLPPRTSPPNRMFAPENFAAILLALCFAWFLSRMEKGISLPQAHECIRCCHSFTEVCISAILHISRANSSLYLHYSK